MLNIEEFEKKGFQKEDIAGIKNIIFDLGGVIIDIHYNRTIENFKKLGFADFDSIYTHIKQTRIFDLFETGMIPPQTFRNELRKFSNHLSDELIDAAWGAMLGEMPEKNVSLVRSLRNNYRTFLLSNTNSIHVDIFYNYLVHKFGRNPLPEMFEHTYMSFEIGHRKPDIDAFQYVVRDAGLRPNETLFIDDLEANIEGAWKAGLKVFHLDKSSISELFNL